MQQLDPKLEQRRHCHRAEPTVQREPNDGRAAR